MHEILLLNGKYERHQLNGKYERHQLQRAGLAENLSHSINGEVKTRTRDFAEPICLAL